MDESRGVIEAILFASGEPVRTGELREASGLSSEDAVREVLIRIKDSLDEHMSGFFLEEVGGGWRLASRPELDPYLRKFFSSKRDSRLSMAALETLAIVAYRQPVTAPEVSDIRGVNSSGVVRTLLERRMVRIAGRKNVVGSPFLYRTTREFLLHFGLSSIQDLPNLEEFAEILGDQVNEELFGDFDGIAESTDESSDAETSSDEVVAVDDEQDDAEGASDYSDGDED